MVKIYTLSCPDTGSIRYVGKTIKNLKDRLWVHISVSKTKRTHRDKWINSIIQKGKKPIIELLDECGEEDWVIYEMYWIAQIKGWGFNLTNHTIGGEGPHGRIFSKESRNKISKALKGRKYSKETIEKMRRSQMGKKLKQETIDKIVSKHIGTKHKKESIKKMKKAHFGKKMSRESRKKMSLKRMGITPTNVKSVKMYKHIFDEFKVFKNITTASNETNISRTAIMNCLNGLSKTAGGYIWRYNN